MALLLALLALLCPASLVVAVELTLFPNATLPYAVHFPLAPENASAPLPAILFLHGNGSRAGSLGVSDLRSQVTWDGIGWALAQYDGNKTGAQKLYAESYLSILPWLGEGAYPWDPQQVLGVLEAAQKDYSIDPNRIIVAGYSLGAFGAWDTAFAAPSVFSALIPSGGGAYFNTSQLQSLATATGGSTPISVYDIAASNDEKEPLADIEATVSELKSFPGASPNITLEIYPGTHLIMSRTPWIEAGIWNFVLNQVKTKALVTATSSSSASASTISKVASSIASSSFSSSSSAPSVLPTATRTGGARRRAPILWW